MKQSSNKSDEQSLFKNLFPKDGDQIHHRSTEHATENIYIPKEYKYMPPPEPLYTPAFGYQIAQWHYYLFIALNGFIIAFDVSKKQNVWKQSLKGVGWNQTSIVCETIPGGKGRLFVAVGKQLFCLDVITGDIQWRTPIQGKNCFLKVENEALYVTGNGYLQAFKKESGMLIYTVALPEFGEGVTSMVIGENLIFVATNKRIGGFRRDGKVTDLKFDLVKAYGKNVFSAPTMIFKENILTAGYNNSLISLYFDGKNPKTLSLGYKQDDISDIVSVMYRKPNMLIVGSGMFVCAREYNSHRELWTTSLSTCGTVRNTISLAQTTRRLYAGINSTVVAIDPNKGSIVWKKEFKECGNNKFVSLFVKGNILFVGCNGFVYGMDPITGEVNIRRPNIRCGSGNVQMCDYESHMDLNAQPQLHALEKRTTTSSSLRF